MIERESSYPCNGQLATQNHGGHFSVCASYLFTP